ncbi:MAG: arginine--tRNA ligase, partial [Frankiaceae bacterium]|nr:arginine--tRNA ligase [Frankiaceae bacterium]
MTPADLAEAVVSAIRAAVDAGDLAVTPPDSVVIERPKNRDHGDYATNAALQLAKPAGRPPRDVAEAIAAHLRTSTSIAAVEVAGPGFLNITLSDAAQGELARLIVAAGSAYGTSDTLSKEKVNLEFVSANPTGPIHLGHTRWAALGDALGRILTAAGADVTREYYLNDAGVQVDRFAESLRAAALGHEAPEDGYVGDYVTAIADRIVAAHPDITTMAEPDALAIFRREGMELMLAEIRKSLAEFGVEFDVYFSEQAMRDKGELDAALASLRAHG